MFDRYMADKAYVVIANMKVEKVFDNKYKTILPKEMKKAAEAAVKGSNALTAQKPSKNQAKTYSLDATVTSLTQSGNMFEAKLSMALSEEDFMFGFPTGHGKTAVTKDPEGDVVFLVGKIITDMITTDVAKAIQGRLPKGS